MNKKQSIGERIKFLVSKKEKSAKDFYDGISIKKGTYYNYVKGITTPDYDFILLVLDRFDNVSAEWLLTGKGDVFKKLDNVQINEPSINYGNNLINDVGLRQELKKIKERLDRLEQKNNIQ